MNLHKHQLYLLKQDSESFKIWSAIIRIDNEGKSLIVKLGPRHTHNLREKITTHIQVILTIKKVISKVIQRK